MDKVAASAVSVPSKVDTVREGGEKGGGYISKGPGPEVDEVIPPSPSGQSPVTTRGFRKPPL